MEVKEEWKKWEPIKNVSAKYYIDYILNDSKIFKIILIERDNEFNKVSILFESSIHAFRWSDETYRYKTIIMLSEKYGRSFYSGTLFKITNSDYIKWLLDQSNKIKNENDLIHFSFIGANSVLDVIGTAEPIVENLD